MLEKLEEFYKDFNYQPREGTEKEKLKEFKQELKTYLIKNVIMNELLDTANYYLDRANYSPMSKKDMWFGDKYRDLEELVGAEVEKFLDYAVKRFKEMDLEEFYTIDYEARYNMYDWHYYGVQVAIDLERRKKQWDNDIKFFPKTIEAITIVKPEGWDEVIEKLIQNWKKKGDWNGFFVDKLFRDFKRNVIDKSKKIINGFEVARRYLANYYYKDVYNLYQKLFVKALLKLELERIQEGKGKTDNIERIYVVANNQKYLDEAWEKVRREFDIDKHIKDTLNIASKRILEELDHFDLKRYVKERIKELAEKVVSYGYVDKLLDHVYNTFDLEFEIFNNQLNFPTM